MEETLDPSDWSEIRTLGHKVIDDMIDYLSTIRDTKVWEPMPQASVDFLSGNIPKDGEPIDTIYQEIKDHILP